MAKIGLKYLVAAKLNEDGTTYAKGFVVAKAIKANITANSNDVKLYADDGVSESDKSFKDGNISLNVDDLTQKVYADLLGHEYKAANSEGNEPETVVASADDKDSFLAKWLKKTQFSEPNDETDTKGETVTFQTPTIEGTVFQMSDGTWKEQAEFTEESKAVEWLNKKAGIGA